MNLLITISNSRLATNRATLLVHTISRTRLATMTTLRCSFFSGGNSASTITFITGNSRVCRNSSCFVVTSPAILIGRWCTLCCSSVGTFLLSIRPDGVAPLFILLLVGLHFDMYWEAWDGRTNVMIRSTSRCVAFMMWCTVVEIWFCVFVKLWVE